MWRRAVLPSLPSPLGPLFSFFLFGTGLARTGTNTGTPRLWVLKFFLRHSLWCPVCHAVTRRASDAQASAHAWESRGHLTRPTPLGVRQSDATKASPQAAFHHHRRGQRDRESGWRSLRHAPHATDHSSCLDRPPSPLKSAIVSSVRRVCFLTLCISVVLGWFDTCV